MAYMKIKVQNGCDMELPLYLMEFLRRRGERQFMALFWLAFFWTHCIQHSIKVSIIKK